MGRQLSHMPIALLLNKHARVISLETFRETMHDGVIIWTNKLDREEYLLNNTCKF